MVTSARSENDANYEFSPSEIGKLLVKQNNSTELSGHKNGSPQTSPEPKSGFFAGFAWIFYRILAEQRHG